MQVFFLELKKSYHKHKGDPPPQKKIISHKHKGDPTVAEQPNMGPPQETWAPHSGGGCAALKAALGPPLPGFFLIPGVSYGTQ